MTENTLWQVLENSAHCRPLATTARIRLANEELQAEGFPPIPEDYQELLSKADGLQSPAFMLLGTEPQRMAGGAEALQHELVDCIVRTKNVAAGAVDQVEPVLIGGINQRQRSPESSPGRACRVHRPDR